MKEWDYLHCLPYFKRMETCLAGADAWRGGDGPLEARARPGRPTRCSARSSRPPQQAGYPLTDDVNGYRQEGFARFDRNVYRGRRLSAARAYLHPVRDRKNLTVETLALVTRVRFEGKRAVGVDYLRGGRLHRSVDAGEVILCGGAINTPQLLQLSGVGDEALLRQHGVDARPPPARRGREPPGPPRGLHPVRLEAAGLDRARPALAGPARRSATSGCSTARGLGATNHFEGGGFARSNEDVDYPNLMFHFLPVAIRYDGSAPTEGHGYQVHIGPMYADTRGWVRIRSRDPKVHPSMQFNYLSTAERPQGVGRGGPGGARHPQPAGVRAVQRRRALARARRSRPTSRSSTGCARTPRPRCTRRARPRWASTRCRSSTRPRCACTALEGLSRRRRLGLPVRHQRQHLRPGDDGRREGRRPDRRQHPAPARRRAVLPPPRRQPPLPARRQPQHGGTAHDHDHDHPRPTPRAARRQPAVHVDGLWKIFGPRADKIMAGADAELSRKELQEKTGHVVGIRDVSFDVAPGEVFVVMGLSGSGKSTLVRLLTRLIEPTAGTVQLYGDDITAMTDKALLDTRRRKVSMVFQHFGLLPHRKVIDNIALRPRGARRGPRATGAPGRRRWSTWSGCPATRTTTPTSSPAACSSASGWPGRWPPTRTS